MAIFYVHDITKSYIFSLSVTAKVYLLSSSVAGRDATKRENVPL